MRARTLAVVWVLAVVAGCTASSDASPTDGVAASAATSATPAVAPLPPAPALPVSGQPAFPKTLRLPIRPPRDGIEPTPEAVIDAFLDLVHDPGLTYRAVSTGRWVRQDTEVLVAHRVDHSGADRYIRMATGDTPEIEVIVRGDRAAGRKGGGEWETPDAAFLAGIDDLSTAIVVGDLGAEGNDRYRLLIDAGFDSFPREMLGGSGIPSEDTQLIVDALGRPQTLTYHQKLSTAGDIGDGLEGVAVATFSLVGEPLTIPPLPSGQDEPAGTTIPVPVPVLSDTPIPGTELSVALPASTTTEVRDLTWYSPDNHAVTVSLRWMVATVDGLRFEVGVGDLPAPILTGTTAFDRLRGIRSAVISRTGGGERLGSRFVTMLGEMGEDVVGVGALDGRHGGSVRVRNVILGERLIVLVAGGPGDRLGSATVDRFFRSLAAI